MKDTVKNLKPTANAAHELVVNFGTSNRDACPTEHKITWGALTGQLSVPDTTRGTLPLAEYLALDKKIPEQKRIRDAEKDGPYFIMGSFSQPGTRRGKDIALMNGFVGDIDSGKISKEELQAKLNGLEYLAYSSYSHSPTTPMWRFILLYATPVSVAVHEQAYAFLQQMFDGQLDHRCKTPAQLWYTPGCPPDAGPYFEFFTGTGDLFDPTSVPVVVAAVVPAATHQAATCKTSQSHVSVVTIPLAEESRLTDALHYVDTDNRQNWITVGMALKNQYGDDALNLWLKWSGGSDKYDHDDATVTWEGLKPRSENGVTIGSVFHLAKQGGWNASTASIQLAPQSTQLLPLFDIQDAKVGRFLSRDAPRRRYLLRNTLPLGKVGMLVAPGGTGKSFFTLQLAVAVATGTRLAAHWDVDEVGSSLILCAEEDDDDLHHRLRDVLAATIAHSPEIEKLIEQRVHIKSMLTENNLMTHANECREIVPTDYVDRLILTARQIPDLKLIVIDPASRFRGGDEIAAQDTTRFVEVLERLRSATGATVLLVHHTNKSSMSADEVSQGAARGSSALTDGVRFQMNLNKPTKAQAKLLHVAEMYRHEYVLATITKNNGAPPQQAVLLRRGPGGVLEAAEAPAQHESQELKLLKILQAEAMVGQTYTTNSLEGKYAGKTGALGLSAAALRQLVASCIELKYLRKRVSKPVGILELTGTFP